MAYTQQVFYTQTINNLTATKILGNLSGGSFTTGTSAGWSTGNANGNTITFTSGTANSNVTNLSATPSAPAIAPTITTTDGGALTTESAAVSFKALAPGQTISMAGLTFTAGASGAAADKIAKAFQSITANSTTTTLNTAFNEAASGTFTAGAPSGWTSGTASGANLTFTSTTANTDVSNLSSALAVGTSSPTITTSEGAAPATTETAAVTFKPLAAGQTLTMAGLTFTAGTSGASAAQVASAFANIAAGTAAATVNTNNNLSDPTIGSFTSGTSAGWSTGAATVAAVTFTSATPNINVTPNLSASLTLTASAPTITTTEGNAAPSTELANVSFQSMTAGQTLTIAGLTFTAGSLGATAEQVASAFSNIAVGTTADNANNTPPTLASAYVVTPGVTTSSTSLSGYIAKPADGNTYTFLATGSFTVTANASTNTKIAAVKGSVTSFKLFVNGALSDSISYGASVDDTMFGVTDATPITAAVITSQRAQAALQFNTILSLLNTGATFIGSNASNGGVDQAQGGISSDFFTGYASNDYFDGRAGVDTAIYRGLASDYTIVAGTTLDRTDTTGQNRVASYTITDNVANRDGADTLINIERLQFSDCSVALDIAKNSHAGDAYRLYKAAFNRTPDQAGLGFWIKALDNGATLADAAKGFINAPEFVKLYGANSSNATFITNLYQFVLHRVPDADGYKFWDDALGTNANLRAQVLSDFANSNENIAQVADLIATGIKYTPFVS